MSARGKSAPRCRAKKERKKGPVPRWGRALAVPGADWKERDCRGFGAAVPGKGGRQETRPGEKAPPPPGGIGEKPTGLLAGVLIPAARPGTGKTAGKGRAERDGAAGQKRRRRAKTAAPALSSRRGSAKILLKSPRAVFSPSWGRVAAPAVGRIFPAFLGPGRCARRRAGFMGGGPTCPVFYRVKACGAWDAVSLSPALPMREGSPPRRTAPPPRTAPAPRRGSGRRSSGCGRSPARSAGG